MSITNNQTYFQGLTILTTFLVSLSSVVSPPVPSPTIVLTTTPILTPLAMAFAAIGLPFAAALGVAGVGLGVASKIYSYTLTLHEYEFWVKMIPQYFLEMQKFKYSIFIYLLSIVFQSPNSIQECFRLQLNLNSTMVKSFK